MLCYVFLKCILPNVLVSRGSSNRNQPKLNRCTRSEQIFLIVTLEAASFLILVEADSSVEPVPIVKFSVFIAYTIQLTNSQKQLLHAKQKVLGSHQWPLCPFSDIITSEGASNADDIILKPCFVHFVEVGIYCSFNLRQSLLAKCTIEITVFDVNLGGLQHQSLTSKYRVKVHPEVWHNTSFQGFQCSSHWSVIYNTNNYASFGNSGQNLIRRRLFQLILTY